MIIIGYQGIGKSTLAKNDNRFVDLESSMMRGSDGNRPDNWVEIYCNIAEDISRQGKVVFVACHNAIQEQLRISKEKVYLCFPNPALKDAWIDRLQKRYDEDPSAKNLAALKRTQDYFDEDINALLDNGWYNHIIITSIDDYLFNTIDRYVGGYLV